MLQFSLKKINKIKVHSSIQSLVSITNIKAQSTDSEEVSFKIKIVFDSNGSSTELIVVGARTLADNRVLLSVCSEGLSH